MTHFPTIRRSSFFTAAGFVALTCFAFSQGTLTPPLGPPAPTMRTLDQIEPRTPISTLPFTITESGSYYFTRNLQFLAASGDAITISASDVTLDLMGFKLSSTASVTGYGVRIDSELRNIAVRNGIIAGNTNVTITGTAPNQTWTVNKAGFAGGIYCANFVSTGNCHFSQLRISACRTSGVISIGAGGVSSLIEQVTASENGINGILAKFGNIINCNANSNGRNGIDLQGGGSVMNCIANSNQTGGIVADYGGVANSVADSNGGPGIDASEGRIVNCGAKLSAGMGLQSHYGSITHCTAAENARHRIFALSGSVTHCTARRNGNAGIAVSSGVVAFCKSAGNNTNNNGSVDIDASEATRTGNNPTP